MGKVEKGKETKLYNVCLLPLKYAHKYFFAHISLRGYKAAVYEILPLYIKITEWYLSDEILESIAQF